MRFLLRLLLNGVAVLFAAWLIPGLRVDTPATAIVAGIALGLVNAIVRPLLLLLTLPLTLLTLGLFIFVVNAICLALVAWLVPGFSISGFGAALIGAIVISLVSWLLSATLVDKKVERRPCITCAPRSCAQSRRRGGGSRCCSRCSS
jgi:putative membrane protein